MATTTRTFYAVAVVATIVLASAAPLPAQTPNPSEAVEDAFLAVRVADVERAAAWYARVFDLGEVNRLVSEGYAIRLLRGGGLAVELIQQVGAVAPPARHLGLFKVGLFVEGIDRFHAEMLRRGVDVDAVPFDDEALGVRSFVMRDLDGNRLQLFERCGDGC